MAWDIWIVKDSKGKYYRYVPYKGEHFKNVFQK